MGENEVAMIERIEEVLGNELRGLRQLLTSYITAQGYTINGYTASKPERVAVERIINGDRELDIKNVLCSLNDKLHGYGRVKKYTTRASSAGGELVDKLLSAGEERERIKEYVAYMGRKWGEDEKMWTYLRPATLFRKSTYVKWCEDMDAEKAAASGDAEARSANEARAREAIARMNGGSK